MAVSTFDMNDSVYAVEVDWPVVVANDEEGSASEGSVRSVFLIVPLQKRLKTALQNATE